MRKFDDSVKRRRHHKGQLMSQWWGFVLFLPSFTGFCVFFLLPFLGSLYYTFTQGVVDPHFVGLANFIELLSTPQFLLAVKNTICFLAIGGLLLIILSLAVSVISVKGDFVWQRWALLLPMVIPVASLSLGWNALWGDNGLVNRMLVFVGADPVDFLRGGAAFPLMVVLYLLKNTGYLSVILSGAICALSTDLRDSYILDSNSETGYVLYILLPQLKGTLLFCGTVAIMNYFLMFRDIYALYGSNPPEELYMLQHFMNRNFYQLNYQRLSTAAFLTVLVMVMLIGVGALLRRRWRYVE